MSDRAALQWGVPSIFLLAAVALTVVNFAFPQERVVHVVKTVKVDHVGLTERSKYDSVEDVGSGLTKKCFNWTNFPLNTLAFAAGQVFEQRCEIVKTGPVG